jgi:glycosyltransferase involved in cell wall biosynthesis
MAIPEADAGVPSGAEVGVTVVAGEATERTWEAVAVALGETPRQTDVLPGAVVVAGGGGLAGQRRQPLDPLGGDAGSPGHVPHRPPAGKDLPTDTVKTPTRQPGGVRVLNYLELEDRLDRSGIGTAAAQQRTALATTDVEVVTSPWRGGDPLSAAVARLDGRPAFREYDLAHCNVVGPGSVAVARHAGRTDRPLVLHAHVTAEDFAESFRGSAHLSGPLRRYLRWFYSQADLILCPSAYTKRTLESYPVSAPIRPITNGVDRDSLAGFESLRGEYRERFDLSGLVVFSVGNVFERKGLTTFCRLARETEYEFAWFGPYDTGPQASATVRRWTTDPPENVTFTGWVDDKRGAFAAGDVYCFPTKTENQGIAVLEAMACGKPVVLRDIPVFEEFYTHGHDCLKCSTRAEFREALDRLADDPALRDRLGSNAEETAADHSLDAVGRRLREAYAEVTSD